jgi:hypothetical protein
MNLIAVTSAGADTGVHHAAAPGDQRALCGEPLGAAPENGTRFLAVTGSLCGRCVDRALARRVESD